MTAAFKMLDALDSALAEDPIFPVEAPDGRKDWPEADRQAAFRGRLRVIAPSLTIYANANAGKRNPTQARKEGVTAGVFDLTVASGEIGARFVAWPEFKGYTAKGRAGQLSQSQIDWGNRMYRAGHHVACFFDPDSAIAWLRTIAPDAFIDREGRL